MIAANRLAKKVKQAEITVINPRPDFVQRVRLHQQIVSGATVATPLTAMLRHGISLRIGTVDDVGDGNATLKDGESVDFDYAILAVGSSVQPIPGTVPVGTWEGAEQARATLAGLSGGGTVTVIGGGPTGIETAAEVAEANPQLRVRLVGTSFAARLSDGARRRVRTGLERLNVHIVRDEVAQVTSDTRQFGGTVRLRSGAEINSDLVLWAIVSGVPDLAARSGLEVNSDGRAIVDRFLRSVTDERIFVVGDCAAVPGARFACQTAMPQGAHAADVLAHLVKRRQPKPHSMGYTGTGLSLGRKDGVVQVTRRDDTARRLYYAGRAAAAIKEAVTRYANHGAATGSGLWVPGPNSHGIASQNMTRMWRRT